MLSIDLGYRGVDKDNPTVQIIHRGKYKSLTKQQWRWLKRRQGVELATISHTLPTAEAQESTALVFSGGR